MSYQNLKVLIFASYYFPGYKGGGPIKTIKTLIDQAGNEVSFRLITGDRDLGDSSPYSSVQLGEWGAVGNALVFYAQRQKKFYRQITKIICEKDYDLIYLNSFFSFRFSLFPLLVAKILRQRILLSPRGQFSKAALNIKSFQKKLIIQVFRALGLHHGIVFQASSEFEAEDIRGIFGETADIRIAGNLAAREFASCIPNRSKDSLRVVFLSRISPMKNLLSALEMLKGVQQPLCYDIYGPIEDAEYWDQCNKIVETLPAHIKVVYKGALYPDQVVITLSRYDVFFLPTKGENYGHVIAEALCAALPVLIADTTPWRNLQDLGIGWELPLTNSCAFSDVLDELACMPLGRYQEMRERVLAWAKERFSQRDTIDANIAMFRHTYEKE